MHGERALLMSLLAAPLSMYLPAQVREKPVYKRKFNALKPRAFSRAELEIISRANERRERRWAKAAEIARRNGWIYQPPAAKAA
jgi:hypothetical protein